MSSLIIEVCEVNKIIPHKNADAIEIAVIKGWEVCVKKGLYSVGDRCVYFPPDSVIPFELSEKLNITKYLRKGRVCVTNLRGVPSYGTVMKYDGPNPIGFDMSEELCITKWEPPIKAINGDAAKPDSVFHTYYSMENLRNFPDAFSEDDDVIVSEKLHGENTRVGLIKIANEKGEMVWSFAAGSHNVQRKRYITHEDGTQEESVYWKALTPQVKEFLACMSGCEYSIEELENNPSVKDNRSDNVILFGERFGVVQDLHYGMTNGQFSFRWFSFTLDGDYVSQKLTNEILSAFNLNTPPILYIGKFNMDKMIELASGVSAIDGKTVREGIVIISEVEQECVTKKKVLKRKQFKLINPDYLTRKNGTEFH